jgi:hypothetical protein
VSEAQEARQLRDENTRLRKLVADLSLDKEALQSVIRKNAGLRDSWKNKVTTVDLSDVKVFGDHESELLALSSHWAFPKAGVAFALEFERAHVIYRGGSILPFVDVLCSKIEHSTFRFPTSRRPVVRNLLGNLLKLKT